MAVLRLHGKPVSNYFNVVRAALIEKQLDFEIVIAGASQDAAFRARSPMGKVPLLETPHGWISETVAILDYLDDAFPEPSLRPADIAVRASGRQIINIVQMYVEAQVRSLFPGVFASAVNAPATVAAVRAMLDRATAALAQLLQPAPFLCGSTISQADLFVFYNLDIADRVTHFVYDRSIIAETGTLGAWWPMMRERQGTKAIMVDFEMYFARYIIEHGGAYRADSLVSG
jgi:glutathione S-transferase